MNNKEKNSKLLIQVSSKYIIGIIMVSVLLFVPAGTFLYWNAWLLMGLLFIPMLMVMLVLWFKDKELLEKRLRNKEKEKAQKNLIGLSLIIFISGFIVAGLDFKYGWSNLPAGVVAVASIILITAYAMYVEVLRENSYLSRIVEVQKDQKIIDTGMYAVVRHPMYFATTILFMSFPIVLGSIYSFCIFIFFPLILVKRIKNEEEVLEKGLKGYKAYEKKVKYKMIPFVW